METRANYAIVGMFTIAVIVAAFGFVYWFAGTETGGDRPYYRVEFRGSVAGLSKGSPVLFNGIRVGEVTSVDLSEEAPDQAYATIQVQKTAPIRADTRATLDVNLLSGVAQVALTGGARDAPPLQAKAGELYPTIVAEPGGLGSIVQTARGTAEKANVLLDLVTEIVRNNRGNLDASVTNLRTFTDALAANAPQIQTALSSIADAANRIGPVAARLETLTDNASAVIQAIEPDRLRAIIRNVEGVTQTVEQNRPNIDAVFRDAAGLVSRLNEAAPKLDQALTDIARVVAVIDPVKLNEVVDNAQRFTAGLTASTQDLQATLRNSSSLTAKLDASADGVQAIVRTFEQNRPNIDRFLGEAANLATRLNESAPKLDALLTEAARAVTALDVTRINEVVANAQAFTATLNASASDLQATLRNSSSLTAKLDASADGVQAIVRTVEQNRPNIDRFLGEAANLATRLNESAPKLDALLTEAARAVTALDVTRINEVVANAQAFTITLNASASDLQATLRNSNELTAKLNTAADGVQAVVQTLEQNRENVSGLLRDAASLASRLNESAPKLDTVLSEAGRALAALDVTKLNQVVDNAQRFTAGLAASTADWQGTLKNANSLSAKLNASADRVDAVLRAAQDFLGSAAGAEGRSTFASVRVAMESFRKASENVDRRATEIAQAISRLSGSGTRQLEALGTDARRAVNNVGRAARNLEQNPSSVIFGGGGRASIPEYRGR